MRARAVRMLVLGKAASRFERRRSGATSSIKSVRPTQHEAKRRMAKRALGGGSGGLPDVSIWPQAPESPDEI